MEAPRGPCWQNQSKGTHLCWAIDRNKVHKSSGNNLQHTM